MGYNVSAAGTKIEIGGEVTITEFADDAEPFSASPVPNADAAMTLAGNMMTWRKNGTVKIKIGVIADSENDYDLYSFIIRERQKMNTTKNYEGFQISIIKTAGFPETYSECVVESMPYSCDATNAGRWKGKVYTFLGFIDDSGT